MYHKGAFLIIARLNFCNQRALKFSRLSTRRLLDTMTSTSCDNHCQRKIKDKRVNQLKSKLSQDAMYSPLSALSPGMNTGKVENCCILSLTSITTHKPDNTSSCRLGCWQRARTSVCESSFDVMIYYSLH